MYDRLDAGEILKTAERLERRIEERFPGASLGQLTRRLVEIGRESIREVAETHRPHLALRIGVGLLLVAVVLVLIAFVPQVHISHQVEDLSELMQAVEATLGSLFFLGTGIVFLLTLESRLKRRRALRMLHKLRTVAHIVDMHQLTKDPDVVLAGVSSTPSSPVRVLAPSELRRYLDYASELLALVSKIAALYAEEYSDPVVLAAVDDIEDLTGGLSQKIWQKITVMDPRSPR
jgi:type VI protein secretion system component VasF